MDDDKDQEGTSQEIVKQVDLEYLTYEDVVASQEDQAKEYHDISIRFEIIAKLIGYFTIALIVITRLPNFLRDTSPFGSSYSILSIGFVLIVLLLIDFIISIPLSYYQETIERRFEFATRTTKDWLIDQLKELLLSLLIMLILIEALYAALHFQPNLWWLYAFLGYFVFAGILSSLSPFIVSLFTKIEPLEEGEVRTRVEQIAEQMKLEYDDIYRWNMSEQTTKANAAVIGFGKTIRIMIGDTLIKSFRPDEIEVVMAHEIAHQQNNDIYRGIFFSGILSLIAFLVIDLGFEAAINIFDFTGKADPATIGYIWLSLMLIMEILGKLNLMYTRSREKAADLVAIDQVQDLTIFESAFARLSKQNLSFPNPSKLEIWYRYSHPPIRDRISYAQQYYEENISSL